MKLLKSWFVIPAVLLTVLAIPGIASSNPVQTPLQSPLVVNGSSNAAQSGQCGFVPSAATQVVQVTEPFTSLRLNIQGTAGATLLITSPDGRSQCVMADSLSGGAIEVPVLWQQGTYSLFVGDRNQGEHPYTLSITPAN